MAKTKKPPIKKKSVAAKKGEGISIPKVSKEPFYQYVDGVLNAKLVVGKFIRQAVERFVSDCDKRNYHFDYKEGYRIIDFAGICHHWKGPKANTPIILDPHQHFYFIQKFGWRSIDTGFPRFRRTYKEIARKTGKTTEAAIESLFHMTKGIEEAAQVWCCATKEDDAIIVVNDAGRIVEASPLLKPKFRLQIREPYVRRVIYPARKAFMAFMSKSAQDAVDTSKGIGDECHDWPNASIKQRIESSMGNRLAPDFTNITTAGFNKFSYCYDTLRDTAVKILNGTIEDDEQLIMMFELDEGDDWKDQTKWVKANPNIPYSLTQKRYLEGQFKAAVNEGGSTEVNFKTKNLNIWTDAPSVWIQDETWVKNTHGLDVKELEGAECFGGLYTAATKSLNVFILYFPNFKETLNVFLCFSWLPEFFVSKNEDKIDYQKWIDAEHVTKTPDNSADHRLISKEVIEICQRYDVRVVGFDKTFGQYVAPDLEAEGIQVMEIYQGFNNLAQQTEEFKRMADSLEIEHFSNPVFRWHLGNTVVHRNGEGLEKPDKEASGSRIGAVSAALNAMVAKFEYYKENGGAGFTFSSMNK